MREMLEHQQIAMHPFITAELSLGSLRNRRQTLATLEMLPQVEIAQLKEVRQMIETHALYGKGIGLTDAHLIASTLITPFTQLWTLDKRLSSIAESLGVGIDLPT